MSQLREDFEKAKQDAYKKYRWEIRTGICDEMFLWAARWMALHLQKELSGFGEFSIKAALAVDHCRQAAKEMEG